MKRSLLCDISFFSNDSKKRDDLPCWVEAAKSIFLEPVPTSVAPWGSIKDAGDRAGSPVAAGEPALQAHAPQEPLTPRIKLHRAVKKHDATGGIARVNKWLYYHGFRTY